MRDWDSQDGYSPNLIDQHLVEEFSFSSEFHTRVEVEAPNGHKRRLRFSTVL